MNNCVAIVLAAGKGTRMKSDLPKVLCTVCGRPMIDYVMDALENVGVGRTLVVVGYRGEDVQAALSVRENCLFVEQAEQLGTGHAVAVCREQLAGHDGPVLVLTGDSPLVQPASLKKLLAEFAEAQPACLLGTLNSNNPSGLGRIVRDEEGDFLAIVEEKDATDEQRGISEVNMSTYLFDCQNLLSALEKMGRNNQQGEYYLTDCPGILKSEGGDVRALAVLRPCEALSINNEADLAVVEAEMRKLTSNA